MCLYISLYFMSGAHGVAGCVWGGGRNFFSYACSGQFRAAAVFNKLICWVIVKYYGLG